jgi:hypothetical protein
VSFDVNWVVKPGMAPPPNAEQLRVEARYIETNPHREWLESVFDLAGVDYGRIDYSMAGGRPVVWEINTNPWYGFSDDVRPPERRPVWQIAGKQLEAAWRDLDVMAAGDGQRTCRISVPPEPLSRHLVRWFRSVRVGGRPFKEPEAKQSPAGRSRALAMLPRIVLPLIWRLSRPVSSGSIQPPCVRGCTSRR